jgi:hypothetical protein
MERIYWTFDGEEYDTYEDAYDEAIDSFDFIDFEFYLKESIEDEETTIWEILRELAKGRGNELYNELFNRCFARFAEDYISEWTEPEEEDEED